MGEKTTKHVNGTQSSVQAPAPQPPSPPQGGVVSDDMLRHMIARDMMQAESNVWLGAYKAMLQTLTAISQPGTVKVADMAQDSADGAVRRFRISRERDFQVPTPAQPSGEETKHG